MSSSEAFVVVPQNLRSFYGVRDAELLKKTAAVHFDGLFTYGEQVGDLFDGETLCDQTRDVHFCGCQCFYECFGFRKFRKTRTVFRIFGDGSADEFDEFFGIGGLYEEIKCAVVQGRDGHFNVAVRGEENKGEGDMLFS